MLGSRSRGLMLVLLQLKAVALTRVGKGHGTMTGGWAVIRRLWLDGITDG